MDGDPLGVHGLGAVRRRDQPDEVRNTSDPYGEKHRFDPHSGSVSGRQICPQPPHVHRQKAAAEDQQRKADKDLNVFLFFPPEPHGIAS